MKNRIEFPRLSGFNQLIKSEQGEFLHYPNGGVVGLSLSKYGEYAAREISFLKQLLGPGDVVVDSAAHIGVHTVNFARIVTGSGQVLALEPRRILYQTLCANIALNGLTNVRCLQAAAASGSNVADVPIADFDLEDNKLSATSERVLVVPLDDLALNRCRLLRLDAGEDTLEVLRGSLNILAEIKPLIYFKLEDLNRGEIFELLFAADYRLFWQMQFLFNPQNLFGSKENIFPRRFELSILAVPKKLALTTENLTEVTDASDTWDKAVLRSKQSAT